MAKKIRVLLGLSGGADSAMLAWALQKKGHEVVCMTVNTGYLSPWAIPNAMAVADALGMKHYIVTDGLDRFVAIYRAAFVQMKYRAEAAADLFGKAEEINKYASTEAEHEVVDKLRARADALYDPIVQMCHKCAGRVHEMIGEHMECLDCPKHAHGITDDDFELYGIQPGAFADAIRPPADGRTKEDIRLSLDDAGILSYKRSDPVKTNCLVNYLMVACCLKWWGKHPYEERFAHRPWLLKQVRWASKLGLFRPLLMRRLRRELLETT